MNIFRRALSSGSFKRFGLSTPLCQALTEMGHTHPTPAQAQSMQALLVDHRKNIAITSETGSGKTLAFLLPVVEMLKRSELALAPTPDPNALLPANGRIDHLRRPRALVLAPSRELAEQIGGVAKKLAHHAKFRSLVLTGSEKVLQSRKLRHPVDMVIATPHRVRALWKQDKLFLGQVEWFVFDEADALFSRAGGFSTDISDMVSFLIGPRAHAKNQVCIFAGASLLGKWEHYGRDNAASALKKMRAAVRENDDGVLHVLTPKRADVADDGEQVRWPAGIALRFFDARKKDQKPLALVEALNSVSRKGAGGEEEAGVTLVFCNSIQSCRAMEYYLAEHYEGSKVKVLSVHGEMPMKVRDRMWTSLKRALGKEDVVMVGTDIIGRGIDFECRVKHVVHFDMPNSVSDFLHRSGRTARGQDAVGQVSVVVGAGPAQRKLKTRLTDQLKLSTKPRARKDVSLRPRQTSVPRRKLPPSAIPRKHMRLRKRKAFWT